jgi:hypothetical protein
MQFAIRSDTGNATLDDSQEFIDNATRVGPLPNGPGLPGIHLFDQSRHIAGEFATHNVIEGHGFENLPEADPQRNPDGLEVLGGPIVMCMFRPQSANLGQRAVNRSDHVRHRDGLRCAGQAVATGRPTLAYDEA